MKLWQRLEIEEALAKVNAVRRLALPTLRALAYGGPGEPPMLHYFGRGVNHLWLDGGSVTGFRACQLMGWAEWSAPDHDSYGWLGVLSNRERLGRLTDAGRAAFLALPAEQQKPEGKNK